MDMPGWMPITIYAIILMGFLGIYSWRHVEEGVERKPFAILVFLTAFMLFNDFVSRCYIYEGFPHWLVVLTTYINFAVLPAIGVQWYQYVRSVITAEERRSARIIDYVVNVIAAIGMLALVLTPFAGLVFSFDAQGVYHRGSLFFFPAGSAFLCIIIAEVFLLLRVRSLGPRVLGTLLAFPVPPLVGGIVAMFAYGVPWMPLGVSLSMVVLFANVQTVGLGRDYLTGVYNRRRLEEFIQDRINSAQAGRDFAGMMVDVDDFKAINDTYGHAVGDLALADAARLIRSTVRAGDVVGRYGGDEFMVLLDVDSVEELDSIVKRMEEAEERFNLDENSYVLGLSKGYAMYDCDKFPTVKDFEDHLDKLMYADKQRRKVADGHTPTDRHANEG